MMTRCIIVGYVSRPKDQNTYVKNSLSPLPWTYYRKGRKLGRCLYTKCEYGETVACQ